MFQPRHVIPDDGTVTPSIDCNWTALPEILPAGLAPCSLQPASRRPTQLQFYLHTPNDACDYGLMLRLTIRWPNCGIRCATVRTLQISVGTSARTRLSTCVNHYAKEKKRADLCMFESDFSSVSSLFSSHPCHSFLLRLSTLGR